MTKISLHGRTAIVTGATRGIGNAIALELLGRQCEVVAVGRDGAALEALAEAFPGRVHPWAADLSEPEEVDALVGAIPRKFPSASLLINNAGAQTLTDFVNGDVEMLRPVLRRELSVNLDSVVHLSIGLLSHFRRQPSAAIVNITSALAVAPKKSAPVYCAAKAALRSFTKALRYQCRDCVRSIRVVDVVMALVDTDMTAGRGRGKISPAQAARATVDGLVEGREEIAIGRAATLLRVARISPSLAELIMRNA